MNLQYFVQEVKTDAPHLGDWLIGRFPGVGLQHLQTLFHQGRIHVNGHPAQSIQALIRGDKVEIFRRHAHAIEPEEIDLKIIYEDSFFIVLDKAPGMPVHPGLGHYKGTVLNALAHYYAQTKQSTALLTSGVVHRLDKDTSGLLIIAKDALAKKRLEDHFRMGNIKRRYEAVVYGHPLPASGKIDLPMGRVPGHSYLIATDPSHRWGKAATTEYQTIKPGKHNSLLALQPLTGRTHQLRIHMHAIGHGILGDTRYEQPDAQIVERLFLHASALSIVHPISKSVLQFSSPSGFEVDC